MMALGINPDKSTEADWEKAADHLKKQKSDGIVRKYYDQGYIDALGRGEVWITQAWSGDIFQKNVSDHSNFKFVVPQEGGTLWTDNMTIPITAKNPVDALTLIDFFYRPDIAGTLAEYINYVSPVPDARQQIQKDAAAAKGADKTTLQQVATSPLVFPADADYERLHYYVTFGSVSESQTYNKLFEPIVLG
jgi:spermidine/putrescine transport system substrate-binding protein